MREIPISSAKADNNGAYISKGSVRKFYMYNDDMYKDGMSIYETLKITGKKSFQQTKYMS